MGKAMKLYGTYKREGVFVFIGPIRDTIESAIAYCREENLRVGYELWDIYEIDAPFTPPPEQWIYSLPNDSSHLAPVKPSSRCVECCMPETNCCCG